MWRRAQIVVVLATAADAACAPSLDVPDGALVQCTRDADCPAELPVCAVSRLCVSPDFVGEGGPTLVRVVPASPTTLVAEYDLPLLESSVSDVASYRIEGIEVLTGALRADGASALLETSEQVPAVAYRLETPGVRDIAGRFGSSVAADFRGFGLSPDELAPDPVTPPDNAQLVGLQTLLSWSGRAAATRYVVEISRQPDFAILTQAPIQVAAPSTSVSVNFELNGTYYWRVTSDVQSAVAFTPFRALHLFEDAVFVACADAAVTCAGGYGTREQPFGSIAAAVALSASAGIPSVRVAGRAVSYRESLIIQQPVSMTCAYDAAFTESNLSHPTTIQSINAVGALFVSGVSNLAIRNCDFADDFGAAAVSVVGSRGVRFERLTIASTAYDEVAAASLLDSEVTFQDATIGLVSPMALPLNRGEPRRVAVLRSRRSNVTLIDAQVLGSPAYEPTGIDVFGGEVRIEGALVDIGDALPSPVNAGTGIAVSDAIFESFASRVFVGAGFATSTGLAADAGAELTVLATTIASASSPASGRAVTLNGVGSTVIANSVLSGGIGGQMIGFEASISDGPVEMSHSLVMSVPASSGPAIWVNVPSNIVPSCEPYTFAFINDIIVTDSSGLGSIITAGSGDDEAHKGVLFLHNAIVTTNPTDCIRYSDTTTSNPAVLGCAGDSTGNVFLARTISQLLGNLAGPDGDVATLEDNDYRPTSLSDRSVLRAGVPTTGSCASQPCYFVPSDLSGAVRTTSPPSIGPYDLP